MSLPPIWKIKRELLRIWMKVYEFSFPIFEHISQKNYDLRFNRIVKISNGLQPVSKKIAIFFIYQPDDLAKSIFVTCNFLNKQGYAILLISCPPLGTQDLQELKSVTWKVMQRPNYGYDFGGYRDGFRLLDELGIKPETAMILNDSIWFPLCDENQMIEEMETQTAGLTGPVFEVVEKRGKHVEYFQSYLMLLKSQSLQSREFRDYWKNYQVSSRKRIVLVRGEEEFSEAVLKAESLSNAPATRAVIFELLHRQSNIFLLKTLKYATYLEEDNLAEGCSIIESYSDSDVWRKKTLRHINNMSQTAQPMGIIPYACIKLLGFSFLKKSSFPPEHDGMRWQYLHAVRNGDLPEPHPDILAEIMASKMNPSLTTEPSISTPDTATKVI